jgi:hypothetical protein
MESFKQGHDWQISGVEELLIISNISTKVSEICTLVGYTTIFLIKPAIPYPRHWDEKIKKMHTAALGILVYHSLCTAMTSAAIAEWAAVEDMMRMAACSLWLNGCGLSHRPMNPVFGM